MVRGEFSMIMKFSRIQQRPTVTGAVHCVLVTAILLLSMQLSTGAIEVAAPDPARPSSKGNEFFLGFFGSSETYNEDETPSAALFVTTDDANLVNFTVKYENTVLTKTARRGQTTRVELPASINNDIRVQNTSERNKGIHVKADGGKLLTVYGISAVKAGMLEGFLALPCHKYDGISKYKYTVFSARTELNSQVKEKSRFLIVGCEANTSVTIVPGIGSQIEVPEDFGTIKRIYVHDEKMKFNVHDHQTWMFETVEDLTGTFINSDKPISVFVGHRCGQVPFKVDHCNYIVEQIPPDVTWGTKFFTVPLDLRKSGERYKIATTTRSTRENVTVNVTCTTEGETRSRLVKTGEISRFKHLEFDTVVNCSNSMGDCRREFCCIETSKPSIVMMYEKGDSLDNVRPHRIPNSEGSWGNPAMVLVPPISQYSNDYTITTKSDLTTESFDTYISYAIPAEYFQNSTDDQGAFSINGSAFSPDSGYHRIYCSDGQICGYGAYSAIDKGDHIVRYNKLATGMYLYVYGFTEFASIAYPAGFNMEDLETPPGPPSLKFPKHDGSTEICITFRTSNFQAADSRSIFVAVQANNRTKELFIDDSNFEIHTINVTVEELGRTPEASVSDCCTEPVKFDTDGIFELMFISTDPQCQDSKNCISDSVGDDKQVICFTSDIATPGVYNVTVGFKHTGLPHELLCFGNLTNQLKELQLLTVNNTVDVLILKSLVRLSANSVPCQADQTPENLEIFANIFETLANVTMMHSEQLNLTIRNMIVEASVQIVDSLLQWNDTSIKAEISSRLIQSFEAITLTYSQGLPQNMTQNFLLPFITLNTQMSDLQYLQNEGRRFRPLQMSSLQSPVPAIDLPPSLFEQIQDATSLTQSSAAGVVFTFYEKSTLFPVGEHIKNGTNSSGVTRVATEIIAAHVAQESIEGLQDPVIVTLKMTEDFLYKPGSERCVSWDFLLQDWTTSGCNTSTNQNGVFTCSCDHLTNFAVIMDICLRLEDCQPTNPIVDSLLTYISYIGTVISIVALVLTIVTILGFKKLRKKDGADHHIQLSLSLLLLMAVALVLITLSPGTTDLLYGGCMTISVLVHYFALVAVMWMGAEALLMFRKVVIVFVRITRTYLVIVSLICWLVPLVPVVASLVVDLSMGDDPTSDIIIRRNSDQDSTLAFCFLSHVGAFWGAFLAPILLIMVFNIITFVCIIFVLFRHVCNTSLHMKQKIKVKEVIYMMIRIGGVMSLFGLTWLFAILTISSVPALRETFQILFTVFNSFQGAFIFAFFCVINEEARKSWKEFFFGTCLKKKHYKVSKFSGHDHHKTSEHVLESSSIGMSPLPTKSEKIQQSIANSDEIKVDLSDSTEKQP